MTRRECVRHAIQKRQPGLVPWQINYTVEYIPLIQEFIGEQKSESGQLKNTADLDHLFENHIYMEKYKRNTSIGKDTEVDLFGLKWNKSGHDGGDIGIPFDPPLADDSAQEYIFPVPDTDFAKKQIQKLESDDRELFRVFGLTFTLYERAWGLRGMEDLLADMQLEPESVHMLMENIIHHHLELLDAVLSSDFDAVYYGDDYGSQNGLIMGAKHWRTFIKPYLKQLTEKVKSAGKLVILHSCGNIREIIPDLIEIGVDCYNTVQPELYDLKELHTEFGRDLCFYGGISNQAFLPFSTPDQVERKCLETMREMHAESGGYILSPTHNITPDIPPENALAILRAAKMYNCG